MAKVRHTKKWNPFASKLRHVKTQCRLAQALLADKQDDLARLKTKNAALQRVADAAHVVSRLPRLPDKDGELWTHCDLAWIELDAALAALE